MKSEEKKIIFNLLQKASAIENGFIDKKFLNVPNFDDDKEINNNLEISSSSLIKSENESISLPSSNTNKNDLEKNTNGKTIEEINEKIMRCTRCNLARTRNNVLSGEGCKAPIVLVITDFPSIDDDKNGKLFTGKEGILLEKMLLSIKLDKNTNCYITNLIKCRPNENKMFLSDEINACISFLDTQIHILKPKMILCMGEICARKLLNKKENLSELRGTFFEYLSIPLMCTYAPESLLQNEELKKPAWADLKTFRLKLNEL